MTEKAQKIFPLDTRGRQGEMGNHSGLYCKSY